MYTPETQLPTAPGTLIAPVPAEYKAPEGIEETPEIADQWWLGAISTGVKASVIRVIDPFPDTCEMSYCELHTELQNKVGVVVRLERDNYKSHPCDCVVMIAVSKEDLEQDGKVSCCDVMREILLTFAHLKAHYHDGVYDADFAEQHECCIETWDRLRAVLDSFYTADAASNFAGKLNRIRSTIYLIDRMIKIGQISRADGEGILFGAIPRGVYNAWCGEKNIGSAERAAVYRASKGLPPYRPIIHRAGGEANKILEEKAMTIKPWGKRGEFFGSFAAAAGAPPVISKEKINESQFISTIYNKTPGIMPLATTTQVLITKAPKIVAAVNPNYTSIDDGSGNFSTARTPRNLR